MWNCTPPGTSSEYGQTIPSLTARPPRRRARGVRAGQPVQVEVGGEDRLQHVPVLGVLGDARPQRVGHALGQRPHPLRAGRRPAGLAGEPVRDGDLGVEPDHDPPARLHARGRLVPDAHRGQQGSGDLGERRGTGGHPDRVAAQVHLDAGAGQVAVAQQRHEPAAAQRPHEVREDAVVAEGEHVDADAGAVGDERVEHLHRLEPLGHGGHPVQVEGRPRAGQVPVPLVRQGRDHPAAGRQRRADRLVALDPHGGAHLLRGPGRQPERVAPVAQVGPHPRPRQLAQPRRVEVRADPGEVALEPAHTAPAPAPGDVGDEREQRVGDGGRQQPNQPPAPEVGQGRDPAPHRPATGAAGGGSRRGRPGAADEPLAGLPVHGEHPLHGGPGARGREQHQRADQHPRGQPDPVEEDRDQDDEDPVGPLGDAARRRHAQALGAGAGVRHERTEHQAGQGGGRARRGGGPSASGPANHSTRPTKIARRPPGRGWSRGRRPRRRSGARRGPPGGGPSCRRPSRPARRR